MNFNIELFNFWHFFILGLTVVLGFVAYFIFRNRSQKTKTVFMTVLAIVNLLIYVFRVLRECDEAWFIIWENLPLHLCGMTVFIFPLAMLIKRPAVKNFCYYVSSAGGLMALLIPTVSFVGSPIYTIGNISFYSQHIIITLFGVLLAALGLVKPNIKGALQSIGLLGGITIFCHGVNVLITALGAGEPNYMFTMSADTNPLLSLAYSVLPVKLVYLFLFIPLLLVLCALMYLPIFVSKKIKERKQKKEQERKELRRIKRKNKKKHKKGKKRAH